MNVLYLNHLNTRARVTQAKTKHMNTVIHSKGQYLSLLLNLPQCDIRDEEEHAINKKNFYSILLFDILTESLSLFL